MEGNGKTPAERPVFYYDLGSPYAYLAAERIHSVFDHPPEWQPILLGGLFQHWDRGSWSLTDQREQGIAEVEARAKQYGLMQIKWPDPWPANYLSVMRAAIFAKQIGKTVAFSLAAFRQGFAAGRDMSIEDNVLIAGAACEIHPRALLKALETTGVKNELRKATDLAAARGVKGVPTVAVGDQLFWGDDQLEAAAEAARTDFKPSDS